MITLLEPIQQGLKFRPPKVEKLSHQCDSPLKRKYSCSWSIWEDFPNEEKSGIYIYGSINNKCGRRGGESTPCRLHTLSMSLLLLLRSKALVVVVVEPTQRTLHVHTSVELDDVGNWI